MPTSPLAIDSFDLPAGRRIAGKYIVEDKLGSGWEGEVYRVAESGTGIHRAVKLFYPKRNEHDEALRTYALKLDRLSDCRSVIRYHHTERFQFRGQKITGLVSQFVHGRPLEDLIKLQPGKRFHPYAGACLLHTLAIAVDEIHNAGEYHGDLHEGNVLVSRRGVRFEVHMVDMLSTATGVREGRRGDVVDLVRLFYESIGGKKRYPSHPQWVKDICRGLRRGLILERFPTADALRRHLERFEWDGR